MDCKTCENYIADGEEKVWKKRLRDRRNQYMDQDEEKEIEKEKQSRRITIAALILVSIILTIALFVFHIIASVKLIQYGNEVLNNVKVRSEINFNNEQQDGDDQAIPILYTVFSFLSVIILICFIIITLYYFSKYSGSQSVDEDLGNYLRLSFGVFLVYLGFYFSTYMVLAFINDPIVTGFVYLIGVLCIISIYLISYFLCLLALAYLAPKYDMEFLKPSYADWVYIFFTQISGISLGYFLTILIFILTLGNFHDFQAVQNLTLPIIIAVLSFFVLKPIFKGIKKSVKIDTTDPEANVNNADHNHTNGTANEDN